MAKTRNVRDKYTPERYNIKTLHEDREYGFFWYEWLWKIVRPVLVFLCSLLIVAGLATTVWKRVDSAFFKPVDASSTEIKKFEIEQGSSIDGIGNKLVAEGLLKNRTVFKYLVQFEGLTNSISYGTYELSPAMDVYDIIGVLTSGSQTNERTITVIPGWTVEEIADYLLAEGAIDTKEEFLSLCNQPEKFVGYSYALSSAYNAGKLNGRRYALEGYLAPDTYRVFKSASAESIIKTLLSQGNNVIDDVFYADHTQYSVDAEGVYHEVETYHSELTMDETIILASMIEREAGSAADYARVSAVFHNRLNRGWKLESDATVNYLVRKNNYILSDEDVSIESAYNTYYIGGLPVGPICNPSKAAMQAAKYPDMDYVNGEYLYFCAREPSSGELAFARTLEEHQANVAQYQPSWAAADALRNAE